MMSGRTFFEQGRLGRSLALSLCVVAVAAAVTARYTDFPLIVVAYLLAGFLGEMSGERGASGPAGRAIRVLAGMVAWVDWRPVLIVLLLVPIGADLALSHAEHDMLEELSSLLNAEESNLEQLNALLAWREGIDAWRGWVASGALGAGVAAGAFSGVVDGLWIGSIARVRGVRPWDVLRDFQGWEAWRRETVRRRRVYWLGESEVRK